MREIEYRAWDKREKRMWWNVQNAYDTLETHCCPDPNGDRCEGQDLCERSFGRVLKNPNYVVMEFTGVRDRNNKKIFEGDIVTLCEFNHRGADGVLDREESIRYNQRKGVVEHIPYNSSFMAIERHLPREVYDQWNNSVELRPSEINSYEIEVIGNIHENPELLK